VPDNTATCRALRILPHAPYPPREATAYYDPENIPLLCAISLPPTATCFQWGAARSSSASSRMTSSAPHETTHGPESDRFASPSIPIGPIPQASSTRAFRRPLSAVQHFFFAAGNRCTPTTIRNAKEGSTWTRPAPRPLGAAVRPGDGCMVALRRFGSLRWDLASPKLEDRITEPSIRRVGANFGVGPIFARRFGFPHHLSSPASPNPDSARDQWPGILPGRPNFRSVFANRPTKQASEDGGDVAQHVHPRRLRFCPAPPFNPLIPAVLSSRDYHTARVAILVRRRDSRRLSMSPSLTQKNSGKRASCLTLRPFADDRLLWERR